MKSSALHALERMESITGLDKPPSAESGLSNDTPSAESGQQASSTPSKQSEAVLEQSGPAENELEIEPPDLDHSL